VWEIKGPEVVWKTAQLQKKCSALKKAIVKKNEGSKVATKKWL